MIPVELPWTKKNKKYEVFISNSLKIKNPFDIFEEGESGNYYDINRIKKMAAIDTEKEIEKFKKIHAKEIAFFTEKGIECRVDFGMLFFTEEF